MWLTRKAKEGVTELPGNIGWLMGKATPDVDVSGAAKSAKRAREALADAIPFGKDSLDIKISRAHHALGQARRKEQDAFELAHEAKERSEHAKRVAEEGQRLISQATKDGEAEVATRVKDAQKRADQYVADERSEAESRVAEHLEQIRTEVDSRNQEAQKDAEEAGSRAESAIESTIKEMAEARQMADDASAQANQAASEAQRRARELTDEDEAQDGVTSRSDDALKEVDQIRTGLTQDVSAVVEEVRHNGTTRSLESYTKVELLELASGLGIRGRHALSKSDLITAVKKAQ